MDVYSIPQNQIIIQSNLTNDDIAFDYSVNTTSAILQHADDYLVSVTRVKIPSDKIQSMYIPDNSDFKIGFRISNINNIAEERDEADYYTKIPNQNPLSVDATKYYGAVTYYNSPQLLDVISRTLYISYRDFLAYHANTVGFGYRQVTIDGGMIFDTPTTTGTPIITKSKSVIPANSPFNASYKLAYLQFRLDEFIISFKDYRYSDNMNLTDNRAFDYDLDMYNGAIQVYLTHPSGVTLQVFAGNAKDFYRKKGSTAKFMFSEGAFVPYNPHDLTSDSAGLDTYFLPVCESFHKFTGLTGSGTWSITVTSEDYVYGAISCNIVGYLVDSTRYSVTSPTFGINSISKVIMASYDEAMAKNRIKIIMTPKIKHLLDFGNNFHIYNSVKSDWEFIYPAYILHSTTTIVNLDQQISTLHRLNNSSRLLISSNALDVKGDFTATSNIVSAKNTLIDFVLTQDSDNSVSDLDYSTDASRGGGWRCYELTNPNPLTSLDIQMAIEYVDGSSLPLMISPGSQAIVRLTFHQK